MLDLIVFIKSSGVNVRVDNLHDTVRSFVDKNVGLNYKFYFVIDAWVESELHNIIKQIKCKDRILDIVVTDNSWAKDFNIFLDTHKNSSKWLLISHDDVVFVTDNYFNKITESVKGHENKIGWITSTSEYYYKHEGMLVTDTFRPGFHLDCHMWGRGMFQLHNGDVKSPDYPSRPVKIHGPMSAIMITTMESMQKIGYCEDWTKYTMLIDEDWSLEALRNNLTNVWVPNVFHLHPNRRNLRKANNRWEKQAHAAIKKKWGFNTGHPNKTGWPQGVSIPVEELRDMYKGTNIPWSSYRNSFDWEFLDDE